MKKGYWTKEKCQEAALNCNHKKEFCKKYPSAYGASYVNNWIIEICSHMTCVDKVSGYWNKEKCQEVSFECENRNQFNKKYRSAYNSAYRNNWLDEICSHMIKQEQLPANYWSKEKCEEVASQCQMRSEFCKKYRTAYDKSLKNDWLDEICSHMKICGNSHHRLIYLFEFNDNNVYIGLTYNYENRCNEHLITDKSSSVYKHIEKTGLEPTYKKLTDYIDIENAMSLEKYYIIHYKELGYKILNKTKGGEYGGAYLKWNYNNCKKEAKKYKTVKEFRINKRSAYEKSKKEGWLSEFYII